MDPTKILRITGRSVPPKPPRKPAKRGGAKKRLPAPERRQQLIDVARDVFLSVGREGVSTHQIAEAAGVNVALLYQHFSSNVELFDVSVLQPLEEILAARVEEAVRAAPTDLDARAALAQHHEALLTTLIETAPMLSIALFGDQKAGREFYLERIQPVLEDWIEVSYRRVNGHFRTVDYSTVAKAVFGIHLSLALYAHLLSVELDVPSIAHDVSDFVYLGFFEPDGP